MQNDITQERPSIVHEPMRANSNTAGQCDCACAMSSSAINPLPFKPDQRYILNSANRLTFPIATTHQAVLQQESGVSVLNPAALMITEHFKRARSLQHLPRPWLATWGEENVQSVLEQMVSLGLLVPEQRTATQPVETPTTLAAWIHTTERCNLRCAYCYLPQTAADMSLDTGRAVVDAVFRSAIAHNYRAVKLKYAGGEPLLRFPMIVELHRHALSLAERHKIELEGSVLSNGTMLTAQMAETMCALNIRLMVSMDGLNEGQDRQRFFPDGQGSFERVAHSVELSLESGLIPEISVTISGRNVVHLPNLAAWLLARDLPFSFNFYRENDRASHAPDLQLREDLMIEGMLATYKAIEANLPQRSLAASLADRANFLVPHSRPCSVGISYLVFDTQGYVSKCQMDITHSVTNCHDPDPLSTVRSHTKGLCNPAVDEKEICRECKWRYWCGGGCPLQAHRVNNRYETQSPNCTILKALYPEVVRVESLRLLKSAASCGD